MTISQGDLTVFITRPISATLLLLAATAIVVPVVLSFRRRQQANAAA
jgi:putative tricarboxylic transport membrane protein